MKTGRNAPCPCGSGKKYKKCCMGIDEGLSKKSAYEELRDTSIAAIEILAEYALRILPEGAIGDAADEFGLGDIDDEKVQQRLLGYFFVPWFCFCWTADEDVSAMTVAERFLSEKAYQLDAYSNNYIEVGIKEPLCYWQVTEAMPLKGLSLRNMATGEERFVPDLSASESLAKWDIVLAQVIRVGDVCNFGAMAPYALPPHLFRTDVEAFLDCIRADKMTQEELRDSDFDFADHYLVCLHRMLHPVMPKITNRDGDALISVEQFFAFPAASRPRVVAGLDRMRNIVREEGVSDSRFVWVVKDILKALIKVKDNVLEVECNSRKRGRTIRKRLEKDLDGLITFSKEEEQECNLDAAAALQSESDSTSGLDDLSAEDRESVLASLDAIHMKWADEKVPALDHKTPRQMVKTKKGRARVANMLNDFEHRTSRLGDSGHAFDYNKLRRDLGLEEE
jgi:hypothetical protein